MIKGKTFFLLRKFLGFKNNYDIKISQSVSSQGFFKNTLK